MAKELMAEQIRQFALEYLIDWNSAAAVRRIGLGGEDARDLAKYYMALPEVRAEIRHQAALRARRTKITVDRVLEELQEELFKPARTPSERRIKSRYMALAMKHLGMFIERHEVTGKDGGPIAVADVSELEIARRVAFLLDRGVRAITVKSEH